MPLLPLALLALLCATAAASEADAPPLHTSCSAALAAAATLDAEQLPWVGGTFATHAEFTAARPAVLSIVNPSWHGVRSAAYALGAPVAEVYIDSVHALHRWLRLVATSSAFLRHIIIHGIPLGSVELAAWLACPEVRAPGAMQLQLHFIWHGSPRCVSGPGAGEGGGMRARKVPLNSLATFRDPHPTPSVMCGMKARLRS